VTANIAIADSLKALDFNRPNREEPAAAHPAFKPLGEPTPTQEMPCQVCGKVKLCVSNQKSGLPDKFQTVDEAFKLIADNVKTLMVGEKDQSASQA
jgi:hypothetical protein